MTDGYGTPWRPDHPAWRPEGVAEDRYVLPPAYPAVTPASQVPAGQVPAGQVPVPYVPPAGEVPADARLAATLVAQKSVAVAGLLSVLLPGVGQLYTGRRLGRGVFFLVMWLFLAVWNTIGWLTLLVVVGALLLAVGLPAALVVWVWAVLDATGAAEEHNREVLARAYA